MKVNWKALAKSNGYKSLKAAYVTTVQHEAKWGRKENLYNDFRRIIGLATNHAHFTNLSIESVLNTWEEDRSHSGWNWRMHYNEYGAIRKLSKKPSL